MIGFERQGRTGVLRIERHERRNALDIAHCGALREAVAGAVGGGLRALVITGQGTSFCAGADLDGAYDDRFRAALYGMLDGLAAAPVPVIAAINGPAIGAGTQLALASDLRVAAPTARFAVPTARNGLAVDPWTVRRLSLLAGGGAARALLLGGASLDADRAHTLGLVDRLGDLEVALAWAEEVAGFAPLTLRYTKLALNRLTDRTPADAEVTEAYDACWRSGDATEGFRARAENRAPRFEGR